MFLDKTAKHLFLVLMLVSLTWVMPLSAEPRWQWENPLAQGNSLNGLWAASSSDLYAVGRYGTIVRFDGVAWDTVPSPTVEHHLNAVWGSAADDIYAVGELQGSSSGSIVLHFDGSSWSEIDVGSDQSLFAVWGSSASDVYIGGWNGRLYHYDGTAWSSVSFGTNKHIRAIWGSAPDNVFGVGAGGTIRRFDGTSWKSMSVPSAAFSFELKGVWGTAGGDVWAVGGKFDSNLGANVAILLRYDGSSWTEAFSGTGYQLTSVAGSAADDVYATSIASASADPVLLRYDGSAWSEVATGLSSRLDLRATWVSSAANVHFGGDLGEILHWDGTAFASQRQGSVANLRALWCSSDGGALAVGRFGSALRYDGAAWTAEETGTASTLLAAWGSDSGESFAVGSDGLILHHDGAAWTTMASGTTATLWSLWGTSADDVYAAGQGVILHYDGFSWTSMALPFIGPQLRYVGIWGSSTTDVYALGSTGRILHYDGVIWSELPQTVPSNATAISGTSATDIQVTTGGGIARFDGTNWSVIDPDLNWAWSVVGISPTEYYYGGRFSWWGRVARFDGSASVLLPRAPTAATFEGVCLRPDGSILAVGGTGHVLRWGEIGNPPQVSILAPADGAEFSEDDGAIDFTASASDPEDGDLSAAVQWSSDLDGSFTSPAALSVGTHAVTARVTDSSGLAASASITLVITAHVNEPPTVTVLEPQDGAVVDFGVGVVLDATASDAEDGDLSGSVTWSSSVDGAIASPALLSAGAHVITAGVTDSAGATATASVTLSVNEPVGPPTADAGPDQVVDEGDGVSLPGSGSDANGTIVGYGWVQTSGPPVTLSGADTATASFLAPAVAADTVLGFTLTVTDDDGLTASDAVAVTVVNVNQPPAADAGADQSVNEGSTVTLSGSGSDADGTIVGYSWSQTGGPAVVLADPGAASTTFTAPAVDGDTALTFQLTVTDNDGATAADGVQVIVQDAPVGYCASRGNNVSYEWIHRVEVGADPRPTGSNGGYGDFTDQTPITLQGGANDVILTPGFRSSSYTEQWRVWVDFDRDGVFSGTELVFSGSSSSTLTGTLTVPPGAAAGTTRMRVSMRFGGAPPACGSFTYGEVEDYSVSVLP